MEELSGSDDVRNSELISVSDDRKFAATALGSSQKIGQKSSIAIRQNHKATSRLLAVLFRRE